MRYEHPEPILALAVALMERNGGKLPTADQVQREIEAGLLDATLAAQAAQDVPGPGLEETSNAPTAVKTVSRVFSLLADVLGKFRTIVAAVADEGKRARIAAHLDAIEEELEDAS
jgi:hypothetical protein